MNYGFCEPAPLLVGCSDEEADIFSLFEVLDQFWRRWKREYLLELREFHRIRTDKGINRSPDIGSCSMEHSDPLRWMGSIQASSAHTKRHNTRETVSHEKLEWKATRERNEERQEECFINYNWFIMKFPIQLESDELRRESVNSGLDWTGLEYWTAIFVSRIQFLRVLVWWILMNKFTLARTADRKH